MWKHGLKRGLNTLIMSLNDFKQHLPPSLESWSPTPLSAFNADADRGLDDYFRTITAASSLPHVESASDLESGGRHTYCLLFAPSDFKPFLASHISWNNKHCLKSKCGVSWDASWVLRCGGQTCRRDVWQILGEYNTWRRGRQVSLRHNLWHSQYT